ncbi:LGFP repeat-containing protein [Corynebacterium sp. CCM 9203]|uniref:LGFP repeat-containing protein n=1 Tax=Corynebacterium sp. CCM 9203 TaxID=3057615 RepID=UPI0035234247
MTKKTRTRILAGVAALGISLSAVACSQEAKEDLDNATDKVADAASDAGDAIKDTAEDAKDAVKDGAEDVKDSAENAAEDAKDAAKDAKDDAKDAAKDAKDTAKDAKDTAKNAKKDAQDDGDDQNTDVTDASGKNVSVPTPIVDMYESLGGTAGHLGKLTEVKEKDGRYLAAFNEGYYIAYSKETGAHRLNGKIAEAWMKEGGLDSDLGLPTAYEIERKDGNGWAQNFEHGDIIWSKTDGTWSAKVETH